ncbi:uncharacterized protein LOC108874548 isoform X1 [Lates calcarifer]|uniref:Uncharacterized protein LOC108874482 isoform X1 n=1 Tax=Lates calcarifer TaxID=8187 RepID=A0AAJ8B2Q8_LATCA|nr:uncharacterized protein LOC108874482 isoform X1 [Lates calcarifer]XP_050924848.1 uncharacterized protein LOC108874487 isoform X1 [Lates calcarifer]XP_050924877.1 uncharacterized protein LOC108874546 isoform X1 [Lates calcarifer]XP_050924879.1 uncharacterized protein LOC108874548 isoform X1 [Lates calcarifer]
MNVARKEMYLLDPLLSASKSGFGGYLPVLRSVSQTIYQGQWTEKTGRDLKGFPKQPFGNDCGIFMLMSALYLVLDGQFDYSVHDMPVLRRWWCLLLLENHGLDSHGKVFAHWTRECQALLTGKHSPIFRLKRKRDEIISKETRSVKEREQFNRARKIVERITADQLRSLVKNYYQRCTILPGKSFPHPCSQARVRSIQETQEYPIHQLFILCGPHRPGKSLNGKY